MRRRVAAAAVARLGTLTSSGAPHVVPCCFVLTGDLLYSAVDLKPKRSGRLRRLDNVRGDPRVSVLVDHYEDDWSRLWWVRLDGHARELGPGAEAEAVGALELLAAKYWQYAVSPPPGPVLRIDVDRWQAWAAS